MLLVHQEGSVKVGEVVRYTLTYTPTEDRILPTPSHLHVRIKNTTAIPYRAAYLVGPYTLHASAYSSNFTPYKPPEDPKHDGAPQFEPNLKAGGHFHAKLVIPEDIQESGDKAWFQSENPESPQSCTWIIEIASQILFSQNAAVHYELLVARDERSLDTGFAALASRGHGEPGKVHDVVQYQIEGPGASPAPRGVYSKAVRLVAEDTAQLWNKPPLPRWPDEDQSRAAQNKRKSWKAGIRRSMSQTRSNSKTEDQKPLKRKKIHLVVLTHGLHSNVGADMLYMKESIDATVKQAREDARKRKAELRRRERQSKTKQPPVPISGDGSKQETSTAQLSGGQDDLPESYETAEDDDDEQVIVRGFSGNVTRTEKGIQYLGKRLAKFILTMTYPDQPFLPVAKSMSHKISSTITPNNKGADTHAGKAAHAGSSIHRALDEAEKLPYTFTSISFIGHSLGGLIQLYAIGYIRKHSPEFFEQIKPINFITMAAPLLGLSNENPLYVRFALDFGLVGRTGQDLGLTWRAPTIARSGWSAVISGFGGGEDKQKDKQAEDPRSKPLLRILPSGPAHHVLKQFRNRTVYANVVNDGIVPLRTSCLLFLDWRGLDRVDNARRDNGLISTMAQFGWNELTGANSVSHEPPTPGSLKHNGLEGDIYKGDTPRAQSKEREDSTASTSTPESPEPHQFLGIPPHAPDETNNSHDVAALAPQTDSYARARQTSPSRFESLFNFFRSSSPKRSASPTESHHADQGTNHTNSHKISKKTTERMRRAQTLRAAGNDVTTSDPGSSISEKPTNRPAATRGDSLILSEQGPPPKTSIFEAASDIINPPIPTQPWLTDPSSRKRSIFHDRIYHPEDIPPPPQKKNRSMSGVVRSWSSDSLRRLNSADTSNSPPSTSSSAQNSPGLPRRKSHHPPTSTPAASKAGKSRTRTTLELGSQADTSSMSVEEKIARAYHRDLSWRKVLVRLEPDAHNNMIVRRMFANAYGWEVVRHLCETHFAETYEAVTGDDDEVIRDRAEGARDWMGEKEGEARDGSAVSGSETQDDGDAREGKNTDSQANGDSKEESQRNGERPIEEIKRRPSTAPTSSSEPPQDNENDKTHARTRSELREATDSVSELASHPKHSTFQASTTSRNNTLHHHNGHQNGEIRRASAPSDTGRHGTATHRRHDSDGASVLTQGDDEFFEANGSEDEWEGEGEMAVSR
ncbi:MAG: hypothetical protein Q9162_001783 [Coniocarpon cinnabarinum]